MYPSALSAATNPTISLSTGNNWQWLPSFRSSAPANLPSSCTLDSRIHIRCKQATISQMWLGIHYTTRTDRLAMWLIDPKKTIEGKTPFRRTPGQWVVRWAWPWYSNIVDFVNLILYVTGTSSRPLLRHNEIVRQPVGSMAQNLTSILKYVK